MLEARQFVDIRLAQGEIDIEHHNSIISRLGPSNSSVSRKAADVRLAKGEISASDHDALITSIASTSVRDALNSKSTIECPDCGREVSRLADKCPHCGRPKPNLTGEGLALAEIRETARKEKEKADEDSNNAWGCVAIFYFGNWLLATIYKGWLGFFVAPIFGPFVWML